jgi:3-deoxy-D-manno-octulosonic-acid transferase
MCQERSLRVSKRTSPSLGTVDVLVLDTVGELRSCYALATVVFVGGSFVPRGGQNILEPAACGKPVVFGPFMHNFQDAVQLLLGHGGVQVASAENLQHVLEDMLKKPQEAASLGHLARTQVRTLSGAAARNAQHIANIIYPQGRVE